MKTFACAVPIRRLLRGCLLTGLSCLLLTGTAHPQEKEAVSVGTGFFVSGAGHIVTAYHVIRGRPQVLVGPIERRRWRVANVLKVDEANDLALLQAPLERPPLALAPWSDVPVGLEALVIGYPQPFVQGLSKKITQGIVNGERSESGENAHFQLSAEVQRGNSGGPVLSPDGVVIGVVRAKLDALSLAQKTGDIAQNVNYALKSSRLIEFLQSAGVPIVIERPNLQLSARPYETYRKAEASIVAVVGRQVAGAASGASKEVQLPDKSGN